MITVRTPGDLELCVRIVGAEEGPSEVLLPLEYYIPIWHATREKWEGPHAWTAPPTNSMPPVIAHDPSTPQRL